MPQASLRLKESVLRSLALVLQIQSPPMSSLHSAPYKVLFRAPGPLRCHWIWPARNSGDEDREWATANLGCVFLVPSMRGHLGPTIFLTKDISDETSGWHDSTSMPSQRVLLSTALSHFSVLLTLLRPLLCLYFQNSVSSSIWPCVSESPFLTFLGWFLAAHHLPEPWLRDASRDTVVS